MNSPENAPRPPVGSDIARRIALIYLAISASWIFGSDLLLKSLLTTPTIDRITWFQTVKGLLFVLGTAGLIFFLVRDAMLRIRSSQEALEQSEERFRRMVDWSPIGVFIDVDSRFHYVNRAMQNLLGAKTPEQLLGRPVLDFIHHDYHALVKQRMVILRNQKVAVPLLEERYRRLDGSYVWVEVTALPMDYDGVAAAQVMVSDIQARKQAEADLRALNENLERRVGKRTLELQQANEDLKSFSYTLSHDLRLPLRSIARFAEQVLKTSGNGHGDPPQTQDAARRIIAATARLDRLMQDLFEYNQLARSDIHPRRLSLVLIVNELVGQLRREPDFSKVQFEIVEPMPWVLAHRPTLALVLQNIMHNALTQITASPDPLVKISARPSGHEMARLVVEDNGPGIHPDELSQTIELLGPSAEMGVSLASFPAIGLTIVRRGVERMGGRLGIETVPGVGNQYWLELPLDPATP